jgi:hypothetical protein
VNNRDDEQTIKYANFGMAAMIPGIQAAVDALQQLLDDMRLQLAAAQGRDSVRVNKTPRENLDRQAAYRAKNVAKGLTAGGKPRKLHPRDPNHPKHEEWAKKIAKAKGQKVKKYSEAQKGYWANMTPEERKAEMVRRLKVRRKNVKIAAKEAVAA